MIHINDIELKKIPFIKDTYYIKGENVIALEQILFNVKGILKHEKAIKEREKEIEKREKDIEYAHHIDQGDCEEKSVNTNLL